VGGKQLQKCDKWLQLFVEMKLYALHVFGRWCQVGGCHLPKIWKQLRRLQTVGQRPSDDTKIDGGSTGH